MNGGRQHDLHNVFTRLFLRSQSGGSINRRVGENKNFADIIALQTQVDKSRFQFYFLGSAGKRNSGADLTTFESANGVKHRESPNRILQQSFPPRLVNLFDTLYFIANRYIFKESDVPQPNQSMNSPCDVSPMCLRSSKKTIFKPVTQCVCK